MSQHVFELSDIRHVRYLALLVCTGTACMMVVMASRPVGQDRRRNCFARYDERTRRRSCSPRLAAAAVVAAFAPLPWSTRRDRGVVSVGWPDIARRRRSSSAGQLQAHCVVGEVLRLLSSAHWLWCRIS